jgi:hypothetical protein
VPPGVRELDADQGALAVHVLHDVPPRAGLLVVPDAWQATLMRPPA